jgi:hypothetical protein
MPSAKAKSRKALPDEPWRNIKHFVPRDFACTCEGLCDHPPAISVALVSKLDRICDLIGKPLTIVSGTRCERHNRKMGGKSHSAHVPREGVSHAADIRCPDAAFRFAFLAAALPMFNRIGVGKDFIHVDDDPELPANAVWLYGR